MIVNNWVIYKYLGKSIGWGIGIGIVILWVIGFIGVLKGEKKEIPIFGEQFQQWFKSF